MKFDDFDKKMRVYETASDHCILPGIYMVARIDGRGFTALTKKTLSQVNNMIFAVGLT